MGLVSALPAWPPLAPQQPPWPLAFSPLAPLACLKPGPWRRWRVGPHGRAWARTGEAGQAEWGGEGVSLRESQGWLWVCPSTESQGVILPQVPDLDDPHSFWRWGSVEGPAQAQDYTENTLDLLHAPHVHPYTHPIAWARRFGLRRPIRVRCHPTREGFEATAWIRLWGQERCLFEQRVLLPGTVALRLLPGSLFEGQAWAFHDPLGPLESRLTFLVGRPQPFGLLGGLPKEDVGGWKLHREDLRLLGGLARARALWGQWPERLVEPDAYVQFHRRALAHLRAWGNLEAWAEGPGLEVLLPP